MREKSEGCRRSNGFTSVMDTLTYHTVSFRKDFKANSVTNFALRSMLSHPFYESLESFLMLLDRARCQELLMCIFRFVLEKNELIHKRLKFCNIGNQLIYSLTMLVSLDTLRLTLDDCSEICESFVNLLGHLWKFMKIMVLE